MFWWIVGSVVVLVLLYLAWAYNQLVSLNKRADGAWSDIDVQLKRRWDLVPALVETVKGYARHESSTLENVVQARSQATQAGSLTERGESERGLSTAVGRLFALAEAYPELKASQNFQELQKSLVDIENNVQYARRYYNAVIRDLNTLIQSFPSNLVASAMGFGERTYFQLDEAERAAPRVDFAGGVQIGRDAGTENSSPAGSSLASPPESGRREERAVKRSNALTVVVGLIAFCAFGSGPVSADSGWSIRNFDVQLVISADAGLDVTETIDADFSVPKHGILREMPIRYAVGMHQYALRVKFRSVDDGEGRSYETAISYEENLMKIRIGSPDFTVQGRHRYRLRYQVERAILWEGNHAWEKGNYAVLRWNATGTEWQVPIDTSKVTVHMPRDLNDLELNYDAWTGYFNARGKDFTKRALDARTVEFTTGPLKPREGITVEISMPADAVARPGWMKEVSWWLADNFPYAVFPATLAACFFSWLFRGRDLPGTGTIVVNYEPPEGLSPAEVGTLVDEQVDMGDISATIIDLAVRGYLKIEEVGSDSWLSSGSDYRFIKLKEPQGLKNFEQKLFNKIFGGDAAVTLSDLQEKFYPVLPQVKNDLYRGLSREGYFDGNPETVRGASFVLGIMLVLAVLVTCLIQYGLIGRVFFLPVIIAGILSVLTVLITSRVMPRKTRKGRITWERIAGLQEYIRRAEVDNLQENERQGMFERLLPYAIIFGLSKRWGKAFANLYREPPDWYQPTRPTDFTTWMLINDIDRSMLMMNQTFTTQPRVQIDTGSGRGGGYSWSSGGFGGGGSSGGGFGGGGGSSW